MGVCSSKAQTTADVKANDRPTSGEADVAVTTTEADVDNKHAPTTAASLTQAQPIELMRACLGEPLLPGGDRQEWEIAKAKEVLDKCPAEKVHADVVNAFPPLHELYRKMEQACEAKTVEGKKGPKEAFVYQGRQKAVYYEYNAYAQSHGFDKAKMSFASFAMRQLLDWYKMFYGDQERRYKITRYWNHLIPVAADVVGRRGQGLGQLLEEPFDDGMGIQGRGVRQDWLGAFACETIGNGGRMDGETSKYRDVPTRVFQGLVGKAMTLEHECPLFWFVPPEFRGKPDVFLSHCWDQDIKDALRAASLWESDVDGVGQPGEKQSHVWVDLFAINQHLSGEADKIASCIEACPGGIVVSLPGGFEMQPKQALRNFHRAWCAYETVVAKLAGLPIQINAYVTDKQDNEGIARGIASLDVMKAEAQHKGDEEFIHGEIMKMPGGGEGMSNLLRGLLVPAYIKQAEYMLGYYSRKANAEDVEAMKKAVEIYRGLE